MKICVTGASGFVGQYVVQALNDLDCDLLSPHRSELDLSNPDQIENYFSTHKPTHLMHLAWYAEHGKFWNAPENFDWVINTLNLLRSFHTNGGERIICAGTCAEYDWSVDEIFDEYKSPIRPHSVYGQCKDVARRLVQSYCEANDLSWAWGRVFFPYGPGEPQSKLIPALIDVFQNGSSPFGINRDLERDFIYGDDVGEAFKTLALSSEDGIFNIASGEDITLRDIAQTIAELTTSDPKKILDLEPSKPDPVPRIAGSTERLKNLGWSPKFSLSDGLSKYVTLA